MIRLISPWIALVLLVACTSPLPPSVPPKPSGTITFPAEGAVFTEGTTMTLLCEATTSEVHWFDENDHPLGTGKRVSTLATLGMHGLKLEAGGAELDRRSIQVVPLASYTTLTYPLAADSGVVALPAGRYLPFVASFADANHRYPLEWGKQQAASVSRILVSNDVDPLPPRPAWRWLPTTAVRSSGARTLTNSQTFLFPALDGASATVEIPADLLGETPQYQVFVDRVDATNPSTMASLVNQLETVFLPRTEALWGPPGPAAGSGKTKILVTGRINANASVIGFFNPADLFPRNTDPASPNYNPGSNEAKLLYVGYPDESSSNYTMNSILATACHEYQHLIHFSRKTLGLAQMGNFNAFREAVFLDEGLSHWTESMVGLGASGGNLLFCAYYLKKTADISLLYADRSEATDNPGIRGALCLYLNWLFEARGGGDWDPVDPSQFHDRGGMTFLRSLLDSPWVGVTNLEHALGEPLETSITRWARSLNVPGTDSPRLDPLTQEPDSASPYLGAVPLPGGKILSLKGPSRQPFSVKLAVLPWSLVFYEPVQLNTYTTIRYQGTSAIGPLSVSFEKTLPEEVPPSGGGNP